MAYITGSLIANALFKSIAQKNNRRQHLGRVFAVAALGRWLIISIVRCAYMYHCSHSCNCGYAGDLLESKL